MTLKKLIIPMLIAVAFTSTQAAERKHNSRTRALAGQWSGYLSASNGAGIAILRTEGAELALWSDSTGVRSELQALLKKHAHVQISGTLASDGRNIKVTSVHEDRQQRKQRHHRGGRGRTRRL